MKNFKSSSFIFIIIIIFFIIDFMGYKILKDQIIINNENETQILVNNLNYKTNSMLTKLLYEYSTQKDKIVIKHNLVMEYVESQAINPVNIDLDEISNTVNTDYLEAPYNINITDKALVIRNSSLAKEIGFDISFAKESFDEHKHKSVVLPCPPLFEKATQSFFSFSDGYIEKNGDEKAGILQISYRYKSRAKELQSIQKSINKYSFIKDVKAFTVGEEGFVHDIILHEYKAYKPTLQEILNRVKEGEAIKSRLDENNFIVEKFIKDGIHFKSINISSNSDIFDNTKIIFSILIDETEYLDKLTNLNIWMTIITILGLLAIVFTYSIRDKETKLNHQDRFLESSMHEIKTPLSIITLNNQLREVESGEDEYSQEIDSAMKVLKMSYEDMIFAMSKDKRDYPREILSLKKVVENRVNYFKNIAKSSSKKVLFIGTEEDYEVNISLVELTRLIDNNLSNAIKYSEVDSTISVNVDGNKLLFYNHGDSIINTKKIFEKHFRENKIVGGHGIGLSIVNDIAKKYAIEVDVFSDKQSGTFFEYTFKDSKII